MIRFGYYEWREGEHGFKKKHTVELRPWEITGKYMEVNGEMSVEVKIEEWHLFSKPTFNTFYVNESDFWFEDIQYFNCKE